MFSFPEKRIPWSRLDLQLSCNTWQARYPFPNPDKEHLILCEFQLSCNCTTAGSKLLTQGRPWCRQAWWIWLWGFAAVMVGVFHTVPTAPIPVWESHLKTGMFTKYSVNTRQSKQRASWFSELPKPKLYPSNCSFSRIIFVLKHTCKITLDISLMHVCTYTKWNSSYLWGETGRWKGGEDPWL